MSSVINGCLTYYIQGVVIGLRLLCSKFYLLFFPEFPKSNMHIIDWHRHSIEFSKRLQGPPYYAQIFTHYAFEHCSKKSPSIMLNNIISIMPVNL